MPKLNEVVAGILRDITQARVVADSVSRGYYDIYQQDPVLSQVPVPRIAIREMTVRLRFAVNEHAAGSPVRPTKAVLDRAWKTILAERVAPAVLRSAARGLSAADQTDAAARVRTSLQRDTFDVEAAVDGRSDRLLRRSEARLVAAFAALPRSTRGKLAGAAALRRTMRSAISREWQAGSPQLHDLAASARTVPADLDILVRRADLATIAESSLQEVTLQIAMDDLRAADPGDPPRA
jgi:hypothetical protein